MVLCVCVYQSAGDTYPSVDKILIDIVNSHMKLVQQRSVWLVQVGLQTDWSVK